MTPPNDARRRQLRRQAAERSRQRARKDGQQPLGGRIPRLCAHCDTKWESYSDKPQCPTCGKGPQTGKDTPAC